MEAKNPNEIIDSDLAKIQPFSGMPEELTGAERMLEEGKAIQKVQTPYTTAIAVQKPRSIARYVNNVLEECGLAGASFYYGWTAKTQKGPVKIEGPSIDLAMCLARNYGNCAIDIDETESLTHFMIKGVFIDLESGFTCPRLFRQRKGQSLGGKMEKDLDRQEDIVFQIGQSKAIRNAIVRAMPRWLIDRAIEAAKAAEIQNIKAESPAFARAKVLSFFDEYGISQERVEAKVDKTADKWTSPDIAELRGSATALKEGRITADELFPHVDEGATPETSKPEGDPGEGKKEEDEDPIRKDFINLGWKSFRAWFFKYEKAIPGMRLSTQDEIKDKWMRIRENDEPYPLDVPKLKDKEPEKTEEPKDKPDPPFMIPCTMLTYEERPEKNDEGYVNADVCDNVCDKSKECVTYQNFLKS